MSSKPLLWLVLPLCALVMLSVSGFRTMAMAQEQTQVLRPQPVGVLRMDEHQENENRPSAWQASTPTAVSRITPTINQTPPSLMPERYQERNPGLLVGAILIVAVVFIGLLVNIRKK